MLQTSVTGMFSVTQCLSPTENPMDALVSTPSLSNESLSPTHAFTSANGVPPSPRLGQVPSAYRSSSSTVTVSVGAATSP